MQPVHLDRHENHSSALKDSLYCVLLGKWSPCMLCLPHLTAAGITGAIQAECHAWTGSRMLPCCKGHRSAQLSSFPGTRILAKHQGEISKGIWSPHCPWLSLLNPREEGCHDHCCLLPGLHPSHECCQHVRRHVTCLSHGGW